MGIHFQTHPLDRIVGHISHDNRHQIPVTPYSIAMKSALNPNVAINIPTNLPGVFWLTLINLPRSKTRRAFGRRTLAFCPLPMLEAKIRGFSQWNMTFSKGNVGFSIAFPSKSGLSHLQTLQRWASTLGDQVRRLPVKPRPIAELQLYTLWQCTLAMKKPYFVDNISPAFSW